MQAPGAWEQPAAPQQHARQHAANTQTLSVEHEVDDARQQAHTWRLEEPADELSMSPGQLRPEQAPAARAAHLGGHHASSEHGVEKAEQRHAGDSRPGSCGAWPSMCQDSHGSSGTASSALQLKEAAAELQNQSSACPAAEEQLLEEHMPAVYPSPRGGQSMHAKGNIRSGGSCELVPVMKSNDGAEPAKLSRELSTSAGGSGAHAADSSPDASQPEGCDSASFPKLIPGMPSRQAHRQVGTAASSGLSTIPAAVPGPSSGQVLDLWQPAASHAAQEPERAHHSSTMVPHRAMLAAEPASTAGQDPGASPPHGTGSSTSDVGQSFPPQPRGLAVAAMRSMVPDQAHELRNSGAASSVMNLSAVGQDAAPHNSSAGLQSASDNLQNATSLGCFAEQCGAAMQVLGTAGDAVGRPRSASSLERVAVAASGSLQEVAESRSVWMQLSAVISEADSILEDASDSCGGSIGSHRSHGKQAGRNSPDCGQSSARGGMVSASSSHKTDMANCSNMQGSMRPAEAAGALAASAMRSDANEDASAPRAEHHSLGKGAVSLTAQADSPAAATADEAGAQSLPGCSDASVLPGSRPGIYPSGAGTPHITPHSKIQVPSFGVTTAEGMLCQ